MALLGWPFDALYVTTWQVLARLFTDRVRDHLLAFGAVVQVDQRCPLDECPMRSISSRSVAPLVAARRLPVWRRSCEPL